MSRALAIAAVSGVVILLWVLYLYRKGRLKENYSFMWIIISIVIILLSTWTDLLLALNVFIGAEKVSDVVLAAFVAFLLLMGIYFSVKLSQLEEQNKKLAQEIAIIKAELGVSNDSDE